MLHRKLHLVGYIREDKQGPSAAKQRSAIKEYCNAKGYTVSIITIVDWAKPSYGWEQAKQALEVSDGVIAFDLNRLAWHENDRPLDLRTLVERLHSRNKVLITVDDGFETVTPDGQMKLLLLLNEWSERKQVSLPIKGDFESALPEHFCQG